VVVNEVGNEGSFNICGGTATLPGNDWVELRNRGSSAVDISGYRLYDDAGPTSTATYVFPSGSSLAAGEIRLLCRFTAAVPTGTFIYGIGGTDMITLADSTRAVLSTTGVLLGRGTTTVSYQLTNDGSSYQYAPETPGAPNAFPPPDVVVNEVSDTGTFNVCGGTPTAPGLNYVELFNRSPNPSDVGGWRFTTTSTPSSFTIPVGTTIAPLGFLLLCQGAPPSNFMNPIGATDTITLFNSANVQVSTAGPLLNQGTTSSSYSRRTNGMFSYTVPSPNRINIFFSPLAGAVFVNEVADTAVAGVCGGQDWIELINTGSTPANLAGFVLHDDAGPLGANAFTFPAGSVLNPGEIRLLCGSSPGSFQFGINGVDTITLIEATGALVSTTGVLLNGGTGTATYQRTSGNNYVYSIPTPGTANTLSAPTPILNEIAPLGTTKVNVCNGGAYIEILNNGFVPLNLTGYVLSRGRSQFDNYTFPSGSSVAARAFAVFCQGVTFPFNIGGNDAISISNTSGTVVSSTGAIGGAAPRQSDIDLTWARVIDLINPVAPFTPFYQYSFDPTPGSANVFAFEPMQLPVQPCGFQREPLACLAGYEFNSLQKLNLGRNPELSGGTFDPRTCNNLVVGDEGNLNEVSIGSNASLTLVRSLPIIGGSTDTEGICFWYDPLNGDKVVIADERDRSGKCLWHFCAQSK
jgi:Lamin Tail Domain